MKRHKTQILRITLSFAMALAMAGACIERKGRKPSQDVVPLPTQRDNSSITGRTPTRTPLPMRTETPSPTSSPSPTPTHVPTSRPAASSCTATHIAFNKSGSVVPMRASSEANGTVLANVENCSTLCLISKKEGWAMMQHSTGYKGYVQRDHLVEKSTPPAACVR